jgi:ribose 5-phosphate isomerase A
VARRLESGRRHEVCAHGWISGVTGAEDAKRRAAERAVEFVRPGMRLGLGTGSTARYFVELIGAKVALGLNVICVPTSETTRLAAQALGIPLTTLDETPHLDLTVDGADEFDSRLRLIKGGGGALLREKIVATASDRMVVIADASKEVATLGHFPLPIEVDKFGIEATRRHIVNKAAQLRCHGSVTLRRSVIGSAFITDGGHYIVDCKFERILRPEELAEQLNAIPGVIEHGLFIDVATAIVVADAQGARILTASK